MLCKSYPLCRTHFSQLAEMRQVPATYVSDFSRYVSWIPSTVFRFSFRKCCLATPFMLHNYWIMTYLVFTITTVECWNLSIGLHAQRCRQNESEQLFSSQPARNYYHKFIHHNKTFINHCTFVPTGQNWLSYKYIHCWTNPNNTIVHWLCTPHVWQWCRQKSKLWYH